MSDPVKHRQQERRFVVESESGDAEMTYRMSNDTLVVDHTGVPPAMQHQGIANRLAEAAIVYAQEQGLKIDPQCRFMAVYLKRHPEHQGLIAGRATRPTLPTAQ